MALRSIFGPIGLIFGDFARAREAFSAYDRLSHMSDAALAERGLKRAEIQQAVRKAVWGDQ